MSEIAPPIDGVTATRESRRSTSQVRSSAPPTSDGHRRSSSSRGPAGGSPSHQKGHQPRPSQELAAHEKLVRKDSRARRTIPRDPIDKLDDILGSYHHEGPFDATLASRQIPGRAPVEATKIGNSLALAATPNDYVQRALERHEPLDGTSSHASGTTVEGQRFLYEEEDVERQGGALGRWPEVEYEGDGTAGSFSDDLGNYDVNHSHKKAHFKSDVYEMQGSSQGIVEYSGDLDDEDDIQAANRASGSSAKGVLNGLKKRLSVKRH